MMRFNLKDGSFAAQGATLQHLIQMAYRVQDAQISGPADLLTKPRFDVDAKLDPAFVEAMSHRSPRDMPIDDQAMIQSLLAKQFKLTAHFETRNLPVYELLVDENGSKLQETKGINMMHMDHGEMSSTGTPMVFLAQQLSSHVGSMVVDKTGLKGNYAFDLHWTPDPEEEERLARAGEPGRVMATTVRAVNPSQDQAEKMQAEKLQAEQAAMAHQTDPNAPPLMQALQQQLGLKLEAQTEPVQVLVIDHVEVPSAN